MNKILTLIFILMALQSLITANFIFAKDNKRNSHNKSSDRRDYQVEIEKDILVGDLYSDKKMSDKDSAKSLVTAQYFNDILNELASEAQLPKEEENINFNGKSADITLGPVVKARKVFVTNTGNPKKSNSLISKEFALETIYRICDQPKNKEIHKAIQEDKKNQEKEIYIPKSIDGMYGNDKKVYINQIIVSDTTTDKSYANQAITREYLIEKIKTLCDPCDIKNKKKIEESLYIPNTKGCESGNVKGFGSWSSFCKSDYHDVSHIDYNDHFTAYASRKASTNKIDNTIKDKIVCGLAFNSPSKNIVFDDFFLYMINNIVLMGNLGPKCTDYFSKSSKDSDLYAYSWSNMEGKLDVDGWGGNQYAIKTYCAKILKVCKLPATETTGAFAMEIRKRASPYFMEELSEKGINVEVVVTGDDNCLTDCVISTSGGRLEMDMIVDYVKPWNMKDFTTIQNEE